MNKPVPEISPQELKGVLEGGEAGLFLLDVREPEEFARVSLPGAFLIPLGEVEGRLVEIKEHAEQAEQVVVYCRLGGRSESAARFLESQGIKGVYNLSGGINAYAEQVDNSLETY